MNLQSEKIRVLQNRKNFQMGFLICEILILTGVLASLTHGKGVDWDEAFTYKLVTQNNLAGIIQATASDVHPPLYYLIAKLFVAVFGSKLNVFTWVSIIPTVFGMLLVSVYIRKRWGTLTAAILIWCLALGPYLLFYSCEIRMYSWMNFFVLGALLMTREVVEEKKKCYWLFLFLFSVAAVYTQYFSFLPLFFFYVYIFLQFLRSRSKRKLLALAVLCTADMVSYLPWIGIFCKQLQISGNPVKGYEFRFSPVVFFEETFHTGLEAEAILMMVLFLSAIIFLILFRKKFTGMEFSFLRMLFLNFIFCFFVSQWLGSLNGHFFSFRYIIYCVTFVWIVSAAIYIRISPPVRMSFIIWSVILGISGYSSVYASEYGMNQKMSYTEQFIRQNVASDAELVYNMSTFDTLFEYYMPGHRFIYFDDLKLDEMKGKTFWFIQLGGRDFTDAAKQAYHLQIEDYKGFGYTGMKQFELERVTVPVS